MKLDKSKLWIILGGLAALSLTVWGAATGVTGKTAANPNFATRAGEPVTDRAYVEPDVVIPQGTPLRIRLDTSVGTKISRVGDRFSGTLMAPATVDGVVILPVGTTVGGSIMSSAPSGRLKGRAVLSLRLNSVSLNGKTLHLATASDTRVSGAHKKRNWAWIGGGSGGGALIGAIAGGPVGAAIGAGVGAGAGVAGAAITGRRQVNLPAETELTFHLTRPLSVPQHPDRG